MMRRGAAFQAAGLAVCWSASVLAGEPTTPNPADAKPSIGSLLSTITGNAKPSPADAQPSDALIALIRDLDADEFETRESATNKIATDESISTESLEALAGQGELSPEAHSRVLDALRRRFASEPRPALGISMQQPPTTSEGVAIAGLTPGFPSADVLKPDDVIVNIGGVSLENAPANTELLRDVVRSYIQTEEIPMIVRRGEERLNLRVPLGRYEDLKQGNFVAPDELNRSWDIRMRRRGLAAADETNVIEVAVPRDSWRTQRRGAYDTGTEGGLVAGGQASAGRDQPFLLQASVGQWRDDNARVRGGFRAAEGRNNVNALPANPPNQGLRDLIMRRVTDLREQLELDTERLADPRLTNEERRALRESVIQRARDIQNLSDQLRQFPPMP